MARKSDKATHCTKCETNYEGSPKTCKICKNKAYLRTISKSEKSIVLTEDNKAILEKHCRTTFPKDTLCVTPSILMSNTGKDELEEEIEQRAETRKKVEDSRKKRTAKRLKEINASKT